MYIKWNKSINKIKWNKNKIIKQMMISTINICTFSAKFLTSSSFVDFPPYLQGRQLLWLSDHIVVYQAPLKNYYKRKEFAPFRFRINPFSEGCWCTHYENKPIQIYWKFYHQKKWKFSDKNSDIFSYFCSKHRLCDSLEPHRRGGSNEYPISMFLSRNKKNKVYPCKPQFYYIKAGFKGVKIL